MSEPAVLIEKLAFGGNGVSRINGKVCFVPFSCPGDEVRLAVTSEKKSYCTARITELIIPSPFRVTPPCSLFGRCGGCFWQHIDYAQQLTCKQDILAETLWRGARVESGCVSATLPSHQQYGYRSRVQFKLQYRDNRLQIGFYQLETHRVEDLPPQGCPVAVPSINQALNSLRSVLGAFPDAGAITRIKVESSDQELAAILSYSGRDRRAAERFFLERRTDLLPLTGLYLQTSPSKPAQRLYGDEQLVYSLPANEPGGAPCLLRYRPGGFAQVNRQQNQVMLALVRRMGVFQAGHKVLDLFCGNGNFTLPVAGQVGSIIGIEESRLSIDAARDNCLLNGIQNAEFLCDDASAAVKRFADAGRVFDAVILDPPRTGAAGVLADICRLSPETIVYVSCDPSTLARDCGTLSAGGYRVIESVPLDMFPQTYHIESVTLLRKKC